MSPRYGDIEMLKNLFAATFFVLFCTAGMLPGCGDPCQDSDDCSEETEPTDVARGHLEPALAQQALNATPSHILTSPPLVVPAGWPQVSAPTAWRHVGGLEYTQELANLYLARNVPVGYKCPAPANTATGIVCTWTNGSKTVYQCPSHASVSAPMAYSLDGARTFKYDFAMHFESARPVLAVSRIELLKNPDNSLKLRCAYPAALRRITLTRK